MIVTGCGHSGIVYRGGRLLAEWGDVTRADMTFSVAKSYLALLVGLALGDGLIKSLDDKAGDYALDDGFKSVQNNSFQQIAERDVVILGKTF